MTKFHFHSVYKYFNHEKKSELKLIPNDDKLLQCIYEK